MTFDDKPIWFEIPKIGDSSIGYISIAENPKLPFAIERVYWTYFTPNEVVRGNHAHKHLKQILVAASGQIRVDTENRNGLKNTFNLTTPNQALYIPSLCWRTLQFSHSAVLICMASSVFSEPDYIRNYEDFRSMISIMHG